MIEQFEVMGLVMGLLKRNATVFAFLHRLVTALIIVITGCAVYYWRFGYATAIPNNYLWAMWIGAFLVVLFLSVFQAYEAMRGRSLGNILWRLIVAWGATTLSLLLIVFFSKTGESFSRVWFGIWTVSTLFGLVVYQFVIGALLRFLRRRGLNQRHILIVGSEQLGARVVKALKTNMSAGYQVQTFFDEDQINAEKKEADIGALALGDFHAYIETHDIDEVWIALPLKAEDRIKEILHALRFSTVNVRLVPDLFGLNLLNYSVSQISGMPVLNIRATPMEGWNRIIKSVEDKILAGFILLAISPLMLALAVGVKLSSRGPVFYRQERVSWNNKRFMILKFRSMPIDAENKTGAVWAKPGEKRATRFGEFIRKTSLDELPQFINVLKGEMSIVGPRPERPVFVEQFKHEIPGYMQKHMVKAGITGWAQVNGWRGNTDLMKRIEYDLYYIDHWSLGFDLKIIAMTIYRGFVNNNAY